MSCTKRKKKKVIQDFYFSDLRAGTKKAGDVTVGNFEKQVDQTLYKINTYHSPHCSHVQWPASAVVVLFARIV